MSVTLLSGEPAKPAGDDSKTQDVVAIDPTEAAARGLYSNTKFPGDSEVKAGDLPEAIKALRDQPGRKMYSAEGTYRDALRRSEFVDTDPEVDKVVNAEISEIFQDIGISNTEASTLITLARGDVNEETIAGWETESNQYLATLGERAHEDLQLARALVQRDPRVAAMLDHTGLSSNPEIVRMMIEKARSARTRGEI